MDEIIFENRNKEYGAFQLRQISEKNTAYGLLLTTSAITIFILIMLLLPHSNSISIPKIVVAAPTDILVDIPPPVLPKPVSPPKSIAPPKTTTAFTTMEPLTTTTPIDVAPPKQSDLLNTTVSTETHITNNTTASVVTSTTTSTDIGTTAIETPVKPSIEKWAEVMPSFVGGNAALIQYLKSHISMDSRDIEMGLSGKVVIQFYVDIDGSIKDAKVIKDSAGGRCAERALTAVNNMPKWNPGKQGDKAVRVYHTLPITFQVN